MAARRKAPKPRRLCKATAEDCPADVVWCGPGSRWENPFQRLEYRSIVTPVAHHLFASPVQKFSAITTYKPLAPGQRLSVEVYLYSLWLRGEKANSLGVQKMIDRVASYHPLPAPPSIEEIRAALGGRKIASPERARSISHANDLLRIANGGAL